MAIVHARDFVLQFFNCERLLQDLSLLLFDNSFKISNCVDEYPWPESAPFLSLPLFFDIIVFINIGI